jgi:hypothetical protein
MTPISEKWLKALIENLMQMSTAIVTGGDAAVAESLLSLITASERVRSLRFPSPVAKELTVKAARLLKSISWDAKLKRSGQVILNRTHQDIETGIKKFSDGLENLDAGTLSLMAAELLLLRDGLERQFQWFSNNATGSIVPGLEKSYPSDEQIRELLPDLDEYSEGLCTEISTGSKASWIWTNRAECLSSARFSQYAMGLSTDPERDRSHINQCEICGRVMGTIDIPGLGKGEGELHGHPDFDTLEKFQTGEISGKERGDLEAHIHLCSRCSGLLSGIAAAEEDRNVVVLNRKKVPGQKARTDKEGAGRPRQQGVDMLNLPSEYQSKDYSESNIDSIPMQPFSPSVWKSLFHADLAAAHPAIPSMKEIVPPHWTLWDDKGFRVDLFRQGRRYVFAVFSKKKGKVSVEGRDVSGKAVVLETSRMGNETTFSFSPQSHRFPLSFRIRAGGSENTFIIRE